MKSTTLTTGVLALLLVAPLALPAAPQNDAGTLGDASDARALPTMLPDWGAYAGELRSQDQDWFSVVNGTTASGPSCVSVQTSGDTYANATLGIRQGARDTSVLSPLPKDGGIRLALAGVGVSQAYFGITPVPNPAGNDPARPGNYSFTLRGHTPQDLGPGDAGTSRDASGMLGAAVPVPGVCFAGALMPLGGLGDTRDAYSFVATANQTIVYSLGSAGGPSPTLTLLGPDGTAIATPTTSGQARMATLAAPGTYYLAVEQGDATSQLGYVVGIIGPEGPPGSPCRPYCVLSSE